jgi:hypothetical protein
MLQDSLRFPSLPLWFRGLGKPVSGLASLTRLVHPDCPALNSGNLGKYYQNKVFFDTWSTVGLI